MIQVYVKTNTNFEANGDMTLKPTACTYKDSENELYIEHFLDEEERWKYIQFDNVVAVQDNGKKKLFRIYNVIKSLYKVVAYARPIFFDLANAVLLDVRPTNKTGKSALDDILANTGFTGHSDISTISTAYYVRKNIVEALLSDNDNSFINRWGGEFYCENFDVYFYERLGSDNGVRAEFGYNLNEIEENINLDQVVTRIIPVGYNGIMLEGDTPWVDSPLINKYTHPRMRVVEFSDVKVKDENSTEGFDTIEEARQELIKKCEELFATRIDEPLVNYKIDMINLSNTTYYKDFKDLLKLNKGDTVTCYIPHLGIDVKARLVDFEKDMLTGEYISIELGNVVNNFIKDQFDIQQKINTITNKDGTVRANLLSGTIDALQTQFKALKDVAQPQDVLGMIFEDRVENSKTFGAMAIGTMGFMIANSYKPGTQDWDYRTFGTGAGFIADFIMAGTLISQNGLSWFNLDDGTFSYGDGVLKFDPKNGLSLNDGAVLINKDGIEVTFNNNQGKAIMGSNGFYWQKDSVSKAYHSLTYKGEVSTNANVQVGNLITLPEEFRGKDFEVIVSPKNIKRDGEYVLYWLNCYYTERNTSNGTFKVHGNADWRNSTNGSLAGSTGITVTYVVLA
ncbi:MAG: phage tail protein [Clostridium sp.]|nr:phage tail protein [Clostridium sp.]